MLNEKKKKKKWLNKQTGGSLRVDHRFVTSGFDDVIKTAYEVLLAA